MNKCKRTTVWAFAATENHRGEWYALHTARNGNEGECANIVGNCGCIHAERNLLEGMTEEQMDKTTMVIVTYSPCFNCAWSLWSWLENLEKVYYMNEYRKTNGKDFLRSKGIEVIKAKMNGNTLEYEVEETVSDAR